jgi:5'-3' exonuclease
MGIKGLFQFLKRFEKQVYIPEFLVGKSVGIDIFWYIHQSKGDMFYLQNYLLPVIKHAQNVYCVFDGQPSEEKREMLDMQAKKRNDTLHSIEQIEMFLKYPFHRLTGMDRRIIHEYVNQLRRQIWQPSPEYIDSVKSWLQGKGCKVYQALEEADEFLIELERNELINVIITNDSDLLVLGSTTILRPYCPLRATIFDKEYICEVLGFTAFQWNDFMYLCKNMKEKDVNLAYSLISVYKELEYVLQKYDTLYRDELILCE